MNRLQLEMPTPDRCFFCDRMTFGAGDAVVEEDPLTVTRVNGRQFQEGQVVVIPKRHAPTLFDLTEAEALAVMRAAQRVGTAIVKAFGAGGVLLYQNNGRLSGQEVPHFHLHVVPQYRESSPWGNGPKHLAAAEGKPFVPNKPIDLSGAQLREIAGRIRGMLPPTAPPSP